MKTTVIRVRLDPQMMQLLQQVAQKITPDDNKSECMRRALMGQAAALGIQSASTLAK